MAAGALDRLIQFRRATLTDDGFSSVETWADHGAPIWASKADLSDGERWRSAEVAASVTTRFTVRWSSFTADLTPRDRLVCEGREYEIVGVKEGAGRRQWLEITAAARTDQ
ncbi:head-tail adaptor protein [Rhodobacter sp. NSM]|uniref:head-tail adaptor protein n=1 Tax=Rhodobacter sp. NSM TaxID=3457501 RepID=UPI003FD055EB